jgi:cytochrome c-type biogenesis protein CcsB
VTCFIGYAAFAVAFGTSKMYISKVWLEKRKNKFASKLPDLKKLDAITYNQIAIGFSFLTLGILTGAVWAKYAWGDYWTWDPKETWALVTWLVYAIYLHVHRLTNWKPSLLHWISIIGFAVVIFTYFGVNYLLSGLHSYA